MAKLPQASAPDWRQYLLRAVIWVSFVGALGYAAANGGLGFLENDINLKFEPNRDVVTLAGKEPAVIQVKVVLRNNTANPVVLRADSACKVFRWQIMNAEGAQVQARYDPTGCPDLKVSAQLQPGATIEEYYSIVLEPSRFQAGQEYMVNARYWNHESEFTFKTE